MSEDITTTMRCVHCGAETEHVLHYAGRILARTTCRSCGHEVRHDQRDLVPTYLKDLEHRVVTKPFRMARRVRTDRSFVRGLPMAILRQPRKFWNDVMTLLGRDR